MFTLSFFLFSGFVHGEEGEEAKQIEFVNGFDKGALLAVVRFLIIYKFFNYLILR